MASALGKQGVVASQLRGGDCLVHGKRWNTALLERPIRIGCSYRVRAVTVAEAKALQMAHGGWAEDMAPMLGKVGHVTSIDGDGDVRMGGPCWNSRAAKRVWNPALLERIGPDHGASDEAEGAVGTGAGAAGGPELPIQAGDWVRIRAVTVAEAKRYQHSHGGWADSMATRLGQVGRVTGRSSNGIDIRVFGKRWATALVERVRALQVGQAVRVRPVTLAEAKVLQQGHGGWSSSMAAMIGERAVISDIRSDGDLK